MSRLRTAPTVLASLLLLVAAATGADRVPDVPRVGIDTSAGLDAPAAERLIRSGQYRLSFFGKNLGEEEFSIFETPDGYVIRARLVPRMKEQVPSEAEYVLDSDRRFVSARYRSLGDESVEARYWLHDGKLIAEARRGDRVQRQELAIEPDAIITGPHYVTDFFVLEPLALGIREAREQPAYAFGFEDWRVNRVKLKSEREKDRLVKCGAGDRHETIVYRCRIETGDETYKTRSWLDDDGVSVRITVDAPIGSVDIRYRPLG